MIDGAVVIDGVVHGYNSPLETYTHPISELVAESLYHGYHKVFSPRGDRRWLLDHERFSAPMPICWAGRSSRRARPTSASSRSTRREHRGGGAHELGVGSRLTAVAEHGTCSHGSPVA